MGIESEETRQSRLPLVAGFGPVLVILLTSLWRGPRLPAQEDSVARPDIVHQRASAIREPCVPTEEDTDPDVFKRPCFVDALGLSREAFGAYTGFTGMSKSWLKVAPRDRPDGTQHQANFQKLLLDVIAARYLPTSWQDVPFFELLVCPDTPITEMRVPGGAPTVVGMRRDCAGVDVNKLEAWAIAAEWSSNGVELMPLMRRRLGYPNSAVIRLRLYGDDRLTIRPRPDDWYAPGARRQFFDREAFHDLLTSIFQVPFETTDDWLVEGHDSEYEGVRVFHGRIRSREREMHRGDPDAPSNPLHWWDEMRLLVTESDPQYFCVEIVLGTDDAADNGRP